MFEKKVNKWIIGAVLGSAILGFGGYSMSPKGKKFGDKLKGKVKSILSFLGGGINQMKKDLIKKK
ncbi:MAG: hypothetical protein V3575_04390 [Candidatus Absconditabacteria bacterium]